MAYFLSIFFGTFLLEDLALASSIALLGQNKITMAVAFAACFLGISIGDLGLYGLGLLGAKMGLNHRFRFLRKHAATLNRIGRSEALSYAIVVSRLIPGTRLPTYVGAGYTGYSFAKFTVLTAVSVFVWVAVALLAGQSLRIIFMDRWLLILICFLIFLKIIKQFVPDLVDPWQRKALLYSWRQWLYFEFWPALLFYLPIVPIYIFYWVKYRSPFMPFYANPNLTHGGLIGESKWEFIRHLDLTDSSTLPAIKIDKNADFSAAREQLMAAGLAYPFILKPDIGQRGFGVRIIRNDFDLTEYLLLSETDRIAQRLSVLPNEAGLFYVRRPSEANGFLFSITDKKFAFVIGDGKTQLGDLILRDPRARIIASVYFGRLKDRLDSTPAAGERVALGECGNHCQGAIFLNGEALNSPALIAEIDRLAKRIPDFYFGRFDIRYESAESLRQGRSFEIVEINGAGSEATHIWDRKTKLFDAYKTLFVQWGLLFEIGAAVQKRQPERAKVNVIDFFAASAKVFFRKDPLSVSS